jgi:outer membrane protein OmpA-like peptidoglycan-associated protein
MQPLPTPRPTRLTMSGGWRRLAWVVVPLLVLSGCGTEEVVQEQPPAPAAPVQEPVDDPEPQPEPEPTVDELEAAEEEQPSGAADDPELVWSYAHEHPIRALAISPDGTTLAVGEDATYLHHLADGYLANAYIHRHSPADLAYSPAGDVLGAGLPVWGVALVDAAAGTELREVGDGFDSRLAFAPDGTQLATGNRDGVVWLWDADGTEQTAALEEDGTEYLVGLTYHPDGTLLAAIDFGCATRVWDLGTAAVVHTLQLDTGDGSCNLGQPFAFSPDGALMAGAVRESFEQTVRFWAVDDAEVTDEVLVPDRVRDLAFSPEGDLLVVASSEATTIIDVSAARVRHTLDQTFEPGASSWPTTALFSPDGGHVAVGRWDGTVEVWRLPGAEELTAPEQVACEPLPIPGDVLFDTGSSTLRPDADTVLTELGAQLLSGFPEAALTFIGHTDSRGEAAANQQLSVDRAAAVAQWYETWAAASGADGWELRIDGRGATELKAADTNAEGEFLAGAGALNRRVEIEIEAVGCAP